jgi:hypothetical protein
MIGGMDELTIALAIIGALTGPAALGWQVFTWHHARKTKVTVSVALIALGLDEPVWAVNVTVTNHNDFPIRISSAGFVMQDGSGRSFVIFHKPPLAELPGTISPHDSAMTYLQQEEAERAGLDLYRPLTGWARTSTDETFRSKPVTLLVRE